MNSHHPHQSSKFSQNGAFHLHNKLRSHLKFCTLDVRVDYLFYEPNTYDHLVSFVMKKYRGMKFACGTILLQGDDARRAHTIPQQKCKEYSIIITPTLIPRMKETECAEIELAHDTGTVIRFLRSIVLFEHQNAVMDYVMNFLGPKEDPYWKIPHKGYPQS